MSSDKACIASGALSQSQALLYSAAEWWRSSIKGIPLLRASYCDEVLQGVRNVCRLQELDAAAAQRRTTKAEDDVAAYRAEVGLLCCLCWACCDWCWHDDRAFAAGVIASMRMSRSCPAVTGGQQPSNIMVQSTCITQVCTTVSRWVRSRMQLSAPALPAWAAAGLAAGRRQRLGSRGASRCDLRIRAQSCSSNNLRLINLSGGWSLLAAKGTDHCSPSLVVLFLSRRFHRYPVNPTVKWKCQNQVCSMCTDCSCLARVWAVQRGSRSESPGRCGIAAAGGRRSKGMTKQRSGEQTRSGGKRAAAVGAVTAARSGRRAAELDGIWLFSVLVIVGIEVGTLVLEMCVRLEKSKL